MVLFLKRKCIGKQVCSDGFAKALQPKGNDEVIFLRNTRYSSAVFVLYDFRDKITYWYNAGRYQKLNHKRSEINE